MPIERRQERIEMDLGSLSNEAQEAINELFGEEPSPQPEEEATAVEESEEVEVDEDSKESQPDEETDEVEVEASDSDKEEPQTSEADIEYIKADGKKIKIDFNDRENIKRVHSLAAGARKWQVERDDLQVKYDGLNEKYSELSEVVDYLETNKDNHEEIFEAITGTSLNEKFQTWAEEQNMLGTMTETEKALYLSNQDHQKRMKEVEKRERELKAKLDKHSKEAEEVENARQSSIANPIFFKYNFDGELGNDQLELRMNRTLWSEVKTELSQFEEVTPAIVEEAMKRISNQIRSGFKNSAQKATKAAVTNNRKAVKKKAQAMAVAPKKTNKRKELDEKLAQGDIAGILAGGFDLSKY